MHPFASLVLLLLLIRFDLGLLLDHQSGVNKKKRNQLNEKWLRTTIGLVFIPQKFTQRTIEISLLRTNSSKERAKTHNATLWNHNAVLAKTLTAHWLIMTSFFVHSQWNGTFCIPRFHVETDSKPKGNPTTSQWRRRNISKSGITKFKNAIRSTTPTPPDVATPAPPPPPPPPPAAAAGPADQWQFEKPAAAHLNKFHRWVRVVVVVAAVVVAVVAVVVGAVSWWGRSASIMWRSWRRQVSHAPRAGNDQNTVNDGNAHGRHQPKRRQQKKN